MAEIRSPVRVERQRDVALIVIDNPPVNALSQPVRQALLQAVEETERDPSLAGGVLGSAGRIFSAGADIREFDGPPLEPQLPAVCAAIEASPKPIVAAIHGSAFGGGLELALACHGRVMAEDAVAGLPEVKLGIIPGAGGTQRLPRLIDARPALEMIATGRSITARRAAELGLAHEAVPPERLREAAVALARQLAASDLHRTGALPIRLSDRSAFEVAADRLRARARGQDSIIAAVEMVTLALATPIEKGLRLERERFLALRQSDQARALRHLFFAERATASPRQIAAEPRRVATVGVLGAGTMGAGIAGAVLRSRYGVVLVEPSAEARERARARIGRILDQAVSEGELRPVEAEQCRRALRLTNDPSELTPADLVIEAISEDMDLKLAVMEGLGRSLKGGAVIASNTSYLDINILAEASCRPQDVIGMHFFAPPERMRLMEIVRPSSAAPEVVATAVDVARALRKVPVIVGVCEGFVGNRILAVWRREMEYALEDGALPHEVDSAMEAYGFPMGPFAVADLSGLDIAWAQRKRLAPSRSREERYFDVADRLCEMGRLGRKTGAGWYAYPDGKPSPDPAVAALIEAARARRGIAPRPVSAEEIQRRARAATVNEAAKILDEGIAAKPADIDLVLVHGYGFPGWRGGPLFEADRVGLGTILADVERLHAANGLGFEPAALLVRLAARREGFYRSAGIGAQINSAF